MPDLKWLGEFLLREEFEEPDPMSKIKIACEECGNAAVLVTMSVDEVVFCPFCGEPIEKFSEAEEGDDFEEDAEDDWDDDGGR